MEVISNSDGTTTVKCDDNSVTIRTTVPVTSAGVLPEPDTVIAFLTSSRKLGPFKDIATLVKTVGVRIRSAETYGTNALLVQASKLNVETLSNALKEAGMHDMEIHFTGVGPHPGDPIPHIVAPPRT